MPPSRAASHPSLPPRWLVPVASGLVLATIVSVVVILVPEELGLAIMGVVLAAAAGVYPGAALAREQRDALRVEVLAFLPIAVCVVVGWWLSPVFLGAGYLAHGVWDGAHHPARVGAQAGTWFPPFCMVFDLAIGVFILLAYV